MTVKVQGSRCDRSRTHKTMGAIAASVAIMVLQAAYTVAPAHAYPTPLGNFSLLIPDRFDFHTWVWVIGECRDRNTPAPQCIHIIGTAAPIAKAFNYSGDAHLVDGRYTFTVDDPFGLRCANVYYGPAMATHDVYSWDPGTLSGTLVSSFDTGCDGAPGVLTYPIQLVRM
jgi:hypothetical protein